jgi:hypothetical protein
MTLRDRFDETCFHGRKVHECTTCLQAEVRTLRGIGGLLADACREAGLKKNALGMWDAAVPREEDPQL